VNGRRIGPSCVGTQQTDTRSGLATVNSHPSSGSVLAAIVIFVLLEVANSRWDTARDARENVGCRSLADQPGTATS
jgi:hypothetical protein